jgi:hypothetical protein
MSTMDVVRRGVLIRFVAKLGSIEWSLGRKEIELEFGITNSNY